MQVAEHLADVGVIDAVVALPDVRAWLMDVLDVLGAGGEADGNGAPHGLELPAADPDGWDCVVATRSPDRPGAAELLAACGARVTYLTGTGAGERGEGVLIALARIGGTACVVAAQDRRVGSFGPAGLRAARRAYRLAAELRLPLLTVVDTEGQRSPPPQRRAPWPVRSRAAWLTWRPCPPRRLGAAGLWLRRGRAGHAARGHCPCRRRRLGHPAAAGGSLRHPAPHRGSGAGAGARPANHRGGLGPQGWSMRCWGPRRRSGWLPGRRGCRRRRRPAPGDSGLRAARRARSAARGPFCGGAAMTDMGQDRDHEHPHVGFGGEDPHAPGIASPARRSPPAATPRTTAARRPRSRRRWLDGASTVIRLRSWRP